MNATYTDDAGAAPAKGRRAEIMPPPREATLCLCVCVCVYARVCVLCVWQHQTIKQFKSAGGLVARAHFCPPILSCIVLCTVIRERSAPHHPPPTPFHRTRAAQTRRRMFYASLSAAAAAAGWMPRCLFAVSVERGKGIVGRWFGGGYKTARSGSSSSSKSTRTQLCGREQLIGGAEGGRPCDEPECVASLPAAAGFRVCVSMCCLMPAQRVVSHPLFDAKKPTHAHTHMRLAHQVRIIKSLHAHTLAPCGRYRREATVSGVPGV